MLKAPLLQHCQGVGKKLFSDRANRLKYNCRSGLTAAHGPRGPGKESRSVGMATGKAVFRRDGVAVITLKINSILGVGREVEKMERKPKCETRGHTFHRDKQ